MALCVCTISRADSYGVADLQALEKQGGFEELVDHLGDVAPSKRDATWSGLAERGVVGWLGGVKLDERSAPALLDKLDKLLQRFPQLKQSKPLMAKRGEVGLKAFDWTFGGSRHSAGDDPWLDKLREFVGADGGVTADLPQQAAHRVQKRLVAEVAWPFWKTAIDRGAQVCKDGDFQQSILGAIEDGVWKSETESVLQNKCWNELKAPMTADLMKRSFEYRKHACPILKAKNVTLSAEQAAKCDL